MADLWCRLVILDETETNYVDSSGQKAVNGAISQDQPLRLTLDWLALWVRDRPQLFKRPELEILGRHLYSVLFTGKVKEAFEDFYGKFDPKTSSSPLRLSLVFHQGAENIARYPWELIFMPWKNRGFFLAGEETQLVLTRFVPDNGSARPTTERRPLRVLVVFCHPRSLGKIDIAEVKKLIDKIEALRSPGSIEVSPPLENPTWDAFKSAVQKPAAERPHILHFVGHGDDKGIALMKTKEQIDLELAQARAEGIQPSSEEHVWISSADFATAFDLHQPHLVFLQACDTAAESASNFVSTARQLVYSKVPAVVAMQYPIHSDDAMTFAKKFYEEIGQGKQIDQAVSEGRRALGDRRVNLGLGGWSDRSFGTPVVYLQSESPIVDVAPTRASSAGGEKVKCPGPGCQYLVERGQIKCVMCREQLTLCPRCDRVISKTRGCGFCEDAADVASASPVDAAISGRPRDQVDP